MTECKPWESVIKSVCSCIWEVAALQQNKDIARITDRAAVVLEVQPGDYEAQSQHSQQWPLVRWKRRPVSGRSKHCCVSLRFGNKSRYSWPEISRWHSKRRCFVEILRAAASALQHPDNLRLFQSSGSVWTLWMCFLSLGRSWPLCSPAVPCQRSSKSAWCDSRLRKSPSTCRDHHAHASGDVRGPTGQSGDRH